MAIEQAGSAARAHLRAIHHRAGRQAERAELLRRQAQGLRHVVGARDHLGGHVAIRPIHDLVDEDRACGLAVLVQRDLANGAVELELVQGFLELRLPVREVTAGRLKAFDCRKRRCVIAETEERGHAS
jgi:hypothetical protein